MPMILHVGLGLAGAVCLVLLGEGVVLQMAKASTGFASAPGLS